MRKANPDLDFNITYYVSESDYKYNIDEDDGDVAAFLAIDSF